MSLSNRKQQGFTLVEILIVVVILGILAAIVIPQFTNASEAARASNLISQLQSIRSQLELYQLQHNGLYPAADAMDGSDDPDGLTFDNLINPTDQTGGIVAVGTVGAFGPYMQKPSVNPFTPGGNGAEVNAVDVAALPAAAGTEGWLYSSVTGEIRASVRSHLTDDQITALNFNPLDIDEAAAPSP